MAVGRRPQFFSERASIQHLYNMAAGFPRWPKKAQSRSPNAFYDLASEAHLDISTILLVTQASLISCARELQKGLSTSRPGLLEAMFEVGYHLL